MCYLVKSLLTILTLNQASGNFNFFVDKQEFHRITGATLSQVYLVRDGVINEYALGHVMNVPFHIQYLDFKWQATGKRPVHYEVAIEFSDFFALLQPSANISNVGRLPFKLDTFRVHLPCSGRLSTEVPVTLLFTFNVKHAKTHNVTLVKVKRNKICLLKDQHTLPTTPTTTHNSFIPPIEPPPAPSLLLAGLLGACAITASIVSILFFIYLRKRLEKLDHTTNTSTTSDHNYEDSPSCLIHKWKSSEAPNMPPPPNPYTTIIPPFWNNDLNKESSKVKEVSPYAYAQIVPKNNSEYANGHIYANQLSSFATPKKVQQTHHEEYYGGRGSSASSLVQIDGFQCGRNFVKEQGHIVERFL